MLQLRAKKVCSFLCGALYFYLSTLLQCNKALRNILNRSFKILEITMNFFDQWVNECQKAAKTFTEAANWQPYEAFNQLVSEKTQVAEKIMQQQTRFLSDSAEQFSKHCASLVQQTDPAVAVESNYSFFCEQQVKTSSHYLKTLDLTNEITELSDQQLKKVFTR